MGPLRGQKQTSLEPNSLLTGQKTLSKCCDLSEPVPHLEVGMATLLPFLGLLHLNEMAQAKCRALGKYQQGNGVIVFILEHRGLWLWK